MRKISGRRFGMLFLLAAIISATAAKIPSEQDLKALALDSLLNFNKAVQAKDFTAFHQQISQIWQKQITPDQLAETFKTFTDQEIDISLIESVEPTFDEQPKIDDDGILVLTGRYPTSSSRVEFRLKYVYEKPAWKLLGIKVNVVPAERSDAKAPTGKEAKALVLESLLAFNKAIEEKSFVQFHEQIANVWRQQTTAEKLQSLFQKFIDQEVDISEIAKRAPAFADPPAIDDDGLLRLKGSYPTRPSEVRFDLAYLYEAPDWKLVKINVKVMPADSESSDD